MDPKRSLSWLLQNHKLMVCEKKRTTEMARTELGEQQNGKGGDEGKVGERGVGEACWGCEGWRVRVCGGTYLYWLVHEVVSGLYE